MPSYPYIRRVCSPIGSGGGDPYRMVRIRCESGVRIKILESGFRNPDPYAFALVLVWFVDPDHVRIRNHVHFAFRWVFLMDPDPRIRIRVRVSPNSFGKILIWYFLKGNRIRASFQCIRSCFYNLALIKNAIRGLRIETRIRDRSPDPRVRPRTGTVERRGTAQQRTTDPASASGSAFRTIRYAATFGFSLAHQKESCWVTGSESSTGIRTFPDWSESSGYRICRTRDAHDEGDSPGRRLPDRSPVER